MTRSLKVYQGEDLSPVRDLTEPTSNVHVIWEEVEAGGKAYRGDSSISTFPMRDQSGETGSPANLPGGLTHHSLAAGNRLEWLVNGVRLFRGRIGPKDYSRGRQKADRAREVSVSAQDTNWDLKGIIVDGWARPQESDVARAQALVSAYLSGNPRVTTNISTTYVSSSNTVTLPARVYDATNPADVLSEISSIANKLFFVTIDDELFYDGWDSQAYQAGLRISDRADEATPEAAVLPCPADFAAVESLGSAASDDPNNYSVTSALTGPRCERVALTLTRSVSAGQSIVVIIGSKWNDGGDLTGVGDDAGNTYTKAAEHNDGTGDPVSRTAIWWTNVTSSLESGEHIYYEVDVGTSFITALERGEKCISAYLFDGPLTNGTESGTNEAAVTSTPSVSVGGGDLIVAAGASTGGATGFPDVITEDADWTAFDQAATNAGSANAHEIWGGFRVGDSGGETYNATIDQARDWSMVGATFDIGSGSGGEGLPTFPPIWDVGPSSTEDGMQMLSGLRLYYGQGSNTYVYANNPTIANQYWHNEESLYTNDPAINSAARATVLANSILARRGTEERSYNVSIGPLTEDQIGCLKYGQLINIKARAIPDADDAFVSRRIANLRWTTPVPGMYFAHMQLDRPMKEAPYGVGPKTATDSINRHVEQGSNSHPEYVQRGVLVSQGDLPYRGASDWTRLAIGSSNTHLISDGIQPRWVLNTSGSAGVHDHDGTEITHPVTDHGNMGAAETFDFGDGSDHEGVQDANLTVTLTGATAGEAAWLTLKLTQDAGGGNTLDLPASVANAADVEAAWDLTGDAVNVLTLFSYDGGTAWYGFLAGGSGTVTQLVPVMAQDPDDDHWYVVVDGDGNAVMAEAP